jgi:hypothetical protein
MIDPSGLKTFIKQYIVEFMENELHLDETLKEAALGVDFSNNNMSIDDFIDEVAPEVNATLASNLNLEVLANKIANELASNSLTFNTHPEVSKVGGGFRMGGSYHCSECHRPHGEWKAANGTPFNPDLLSNGRTILVLDNF